MNETQTLRDLVLKAKDSGLSFRQMEEKVAAAEAREPRGLRLNRTTASKIARGVHGGDAEDGTIRAIALVAGVPDHVAFAAAGRRTNGPPFADELPAGVDDLDPTERRVALDLLRVLVSQRKELNRHDQLAGYDPADDHPWSATDSPDPTPAARASGTEDEKISIVDGQHRSSRIKDLVEGTSGIDWTNRDTSLAGIGSKYTVGDLLDEVSSLSDDELASAAVPGSWIRVYVVENRPELAIAAMPAISDLQPGIDDDVWEAFLDSLRHFDRSVYAFNVVNANGGDLNAVVKRLITDVEIVCDRLEEILELATELRPLALLAEWFRPHFSSVWEGIAAMSRPSIDDEREAIDHARHRVLEVEEGLQWVTDHAPTAARYIEAGDRLAEYGEQAIRLREMDYAEYAVLAEQFAYAFLEFLAAHNTDANPPDPAIIESGVSRINTTISILARTARNHPAIAKSVTRLEQAAAAANERIKQSVEVGAAKTPAAVKRTLATVGAPPPTRDTYDLAANDNSEVVWGPPGRVTHVDGDTGERELDAGDRCPPSDVTEAGKLTPAVEQRQSDYDLVARTRDPRFRPQDPDAYDNTIGEETQVDPNGDGGA